MSNNHPHSHEQLNILKVSKNLVIGIILNLIYVAAEAIAGFIIGSLALISDAGHNFTDASALFLSLIAFRLVKIKATKTNTYGLRKTSVAISLFNSLLIVFAVGMIIKEAVERFSHPQQFDGFIVSTIAGVGVLINFATAFLFLKDKEKDINIKGAYIHMLADGLVSVGVVITGIIIKFSNAFWVDPMISIVIAIIVFYSSWDLLKESVRLTIDAIPKGINMEEVKTKVKNINGIMDFHHIHIWPISTAENALTAHLSVSNQLTNQEIEKLKQKVKHELEHLNIKHTTLEIEYSDENCEAKEC